MKFLFIFLIINNIFCNSVKFVDIRGANIEVCDGEIIFPSTKQSSIIINIYGDSSNKHNTQWEAFWGCLAKEEIWNKDVINNIIIKSKPIEINLFCDTINRFNIGIIEAFNNDSLFRYVGSDKFKINKEYNILTKNFTKILIESGFIAKWEYYINNTLGRSLKWEYSIHRIYTKSFLNNARYMKSFYPIGFELIATVK